MNNLFRFMIIPFILLAALPAVCGAQNLKIAKVGEVTKKNGAKEFVIPSTTLVIDLVVKKENIKKGEYARFAQKYIGVIAPLADKEMYTIESANIQWFDTDSPLAAEVNPLPEPSCEVISHINPGADFMRVLPDKVSSAVKNAEDAAKSAADMIYDIRKRRVELIMGDIGENIYGEGLRAAIERMDKIENEYLELFLGKQSSATYGIRFYVVPEKGKNSYVICRLNESKGILPVEDLSGQPILLELRPEGLAAGAYASQPVIEETGRKGARNQPEISTVEYMVSDMVKCTVTDGKNNLSSARIPVYQMGVRINM